MKINSENLYSITEISSNFSKLARHADENGYAGVIKNSKLSYILLPFDKLKEEKITKDEDIEEIAQRLIRKIKDEYNIQLKLDLD